ATSPRSASSCRVRTTIECASILKWRLAAARVSEKPKPSAPRVANSWFRKGRMRSGWVESKSLVATIGPACPPRRCLTYGVRGSGPTSGSLAASPSGPPRSGHTPVRSEQLASLDRPGHGDAGGEPLRLRTGARSRLGGRPRLGDAVDDLEDSLDVDVVGFGRLEHRLVVHREVVHDVARVLAEVVLTVHPVETVADDVADLVAVGRIVDAHRRVRGRQHRGVPVSMLETLPCQGGPACGGTDDEPARHLVPGGPEGVAGALEAEHRVEHVDRDHRLAQRRVRGARGGEP